MFEEQSLATATATTILAGGQYFLITNWHVVAGRDADTGECLDRNAAVPNRLSVRFHAASGLGSWVELSIPLLNEFGEPLWIEHPQGSNVDVVALPLEVPAGVALYPLDFELRNSDILVMPAMPASVIGYPFGLASGESWPIWKTGHIASDPDVDYQEGKPAFLIDATTRKGMSGSPVVVRISGSYMNLDGSCVVTTGLPTKFLGIYAGRIHDQSEIGRVWRPFVIREVLSRRLLFDDESKREVPNRLSHCPCGRSVRFRDCCGAIVS